MSEAARAYREALALDEGTVDPASAGADWFNYGQFLKKRGLEPRLVAACFIKAEQLLATTSDSRVETVRDEISRFERDQPAAIKDARANLVGALSDARLLK